MSILGLGAYSRGLGLEGLERGGRVPEGVCVLTKSV